MSRQKQLHEYGIMPKSEGRFSANDDDIWWTSAEVTKYLKIHPKTLMNLVSLGKVPYYKLFHSNRYKKSDIEALITPPGRGQ